MTNKKDPNQSLSDRLLQLLRLRAQETSSTWSATNAAEKLEQAALDVKEQAASRRQEAESKQLQLFTDVTLRIRQSLSLKDIVETTVKEIHTLLATDRVVVYRFSDDWSGTVIAESVTAEWPKIINTQVDDPCFREHQVEQYKNGRVYALNDIYQAGLTECHVKMLERYAVKANLAAPVFQGKQLFGLLIAHQCKSPRIWQQWEIALFTQLAIQVGFALDQAYLLEQQAGETKRMQLFTGMMLRLRQSLKFEDILTTAVEETRKALSTERVVIYRFDSDYSKGTVLAEAIVPVWTSTWSETVDDPYFRQHQHVEQYEKACVRALNKIDIADLTDAEFKTSERFGVKAELVAPIFRDNQLFGLLIAHHCLAPRIWQQMEIDLFTQLAVQVGFALDQAQLLEQQAAAAKRVQLFTDITLRLRRSLDFQSIVETGVANVRTALLAERVVVCRFDSQGQGIAIAESVASGWTPAYNKKLEDLSFRQDHLKQYEAGRAWAINNIYTAGLTYYHVQLLQQFEVQASLAAPIFRDNQLFGLLMAHHCSTPRLWQQSEIDLFTQIAIQIGFALDQANLLEQQIEFAEEQARLLKQVKTARQADAVVAQEQRQQKDKLQSQLAKLVNDLEETSRGDLTVRAEVTDDEIGTVADFFNTIIESLRQIVTQVKQSATQVNVSVGKNEGAIYQLADEALKQAQQITHTLDAVEQMALSIQQVADSAGLAAEVARTASTTAEVGGVAMKHTVQSILTLRETVAKAVRKMERLDESSQQISRLVSLLNQITMQINVLAINAGVEASRAGEEGRSFAVMAEQVGQLAARSAVATEEIEQLVQNIQSETSEVVRAMEMGTTQVMEGTNLVEDTQTRLEQILKVSHQMNQLVQSISSATVSQAQTTQAVAIAMQEIAKVSESTADSSHQVSSSLQQTVGVAQQLQALVGVFKIDD